MTSEWNNNVKADITKRIIHFIFPYCETITETERERERGVCNVTYKGVLRSFISISFGFVTQSP